MGKKQPRMKSKRASGKEKAADEEASLKKVDCDWSKSSVRARDLEDLRDRALLPPLEEMKTRAPGKDVIPSPRDASVCASSTSSHAGLAFPFILSSVASYMFTGFRSMI